MRPLALAWAPVMSVMPLVMSVPCSTSESACLEPAHDFMKAHARNATATKRGSILMQMCWCAGTACVDVHPVVSLCTVVRQGAQDAGS